jgi:N-acetylglucosamine-6-phosphate deacetylase
MTDTTVFVGEAAAIVIQDGRIVMTGQLAAMSLPAGARTVDVGDLLLAPGLIDIQINGGFGHDFTQDAASIWDVGARLPAFGVTSFLPTVVTSARSGRESMMATLTAGPPPGYLGAIPLGAHFEGPFISPDASGAHDPALLRLPANADADVERWSPDNGVSMVTLAPELDGALALASSLVRRGVVVSAGHSRATRDQAVAGFDAGITYATHLFNAMPPLGHREPGLPGAALGDPRVTVGLIADGIHVHGDVVRVAAAAAGAERLSLVTDATAALGMLEGQYELGGRDVVLDGTSVRLSEDGRLAGSALTADEAIRRFMAMSGRSNADAIAAMTTVPSSLLGLADRGRVEVGQRADLTLWTQDLKLVATYIGGEKWG